MTTMCPIRKCAKLRRREKVAAEHQLMRWTRFTQRGLSTGPKSPSIGYAAAQNQSMPWASRGQGMLRLCRCTKPKHALAARGPENRMVPTVCGEHDRYDVSGVAKRPRSVVIQESHATERSFPAGAMSASRQEAVPFRTAMQRLEANAGCFERQSGEGGKFGLYTPCGRLGGEGAAEAEANAVE